MTASNRVVLSSDHAAIPLRQAIAAHVAAQGWVVVDIGPVTAESTPYPKHGEAAARLVASGDCRLGIILCGTGQGIMMAANKVRGIRCGVCSDTFSARMIRQHNDANMLSLGARVVGEGLALEAQRSSAANSAVAPEEVEARRAAVQERGRGQG